jgi:PAT family beta-lactamase induction signal transducer AmpG
MISGHLQEMMGYVSYFTFVMAATIPSFLATWFVPFHNDDGMGTDTAALRSDPSPASSAAQGS